MQRKLLFVTVTIVAMALGWAAATAFGGGGEATATGYLVIGRGTPDMPDRLWILSGTGDRSQIEVPGGMTVRVGRVTWLPEDCPKWRDCVPCECISPRPSPNPLPGIEVPHDGIPVDFP